MHMFYFLKSRMMIIMIKRMLSMIMHFMMMVLICNAVPMNIVMMKIMIMTMLMVTIIIIIIKVVMVIIIAVSNHNINSHNVSCLTQQPTTIHSQMLGQLGNEKALHSRDPHVSDAGSTGQRVGVALRRLLMPQMLCQLGKENALRS